MIKKISILSIIFLTVLTLIQPNITHAASNSCGLKYEVSIINKNGDFDVVGCYDTFDKAKTVMEQKGDYAVIRHDKGYSRTKIIAISKGIAYGYPSRSGSSTMNMWSTVNKGGKTTYTTGYREFDLPETVTYDGKGNGMVSIKFNGFDGYANLKELDLVPQRYLEEGLKISLGDNISIVPHQNYYSAETSNNYTNLVFNWYSGNSSSKNRIVLGVAPDWMKEGNKYYSHNGYEFYTDDGFKNKAGTYYNYYQFLPLRSESNISADTYNEFLKELGYNSKPNGGSLKSNQSQLWNEGKTFLEGQEKYGVNALIIFSMACLESGSGRSSYAVNRNNLFGWNAVDSDPDKASYFESIPQAILEHMGINILGYLDIEDWRYFGSFVGNKGSGFNVKYASDPYWGMKIASLAYEIDRFANDFDGNLTDYDNDTRIVVTKYNAALKSKPDSSSKTIFTTTYGNNYQENYMAIMLEDCGDWVKVASTNALDSNQKIITVGYGYVPYNRSQSVGYFKKSEVQILDQSKKEYDEEKYVQKINSISINNGMLSINGYAYQGDASFNDNLKHTLLINDTEYPLDKVKVAVDNYENAGFNDIIDISKLEIGDYTLKIKTTANDFERIVDLNVNKYENTTNNRQYIISKTENGTILSIKPIDSDLKHISSLKEVEFNDGILSLKGVSFISGTDNSDISHKLIVVDAENEDVVTSYALDKSKGDYNLSEVYNDGYNYDYGWYEDNVDLSNLEVGNYYFLIESSANSKSYQKRLYASDSIKASYDSSSAKINSNYYSIDMQYSYSYRLELNVTKYNLEKEFKNPLPRIRDAYQSLISAKIVDDKIIFSGSAFIWNASFAKENHPVYTLYSLNKTTGEIIDASAEGSNKLGEENAPWSNTDNNGGTYNYDYTWFTIPVSINELNKGEYDFVLKIETDDYVEYIDLTKLSESGLDSGESDGKDIDIHLSENDKQKVEMTIK